MAAKKKPRTRTAPVTVKQVASTWRMFGGVVGATVVVVGAIITLLSLRFASTSEVQTVKEVHKQDVFRLETTDLELKSSLSTMKLDDVNNKKDIGDVKADIKEIRADQKQTSENMIRLMEHFSVQPVPKK